MDGSGRQTGNKPTAMKYIICFFLFLPFLGQAQSRDTYVGLDGAVYFGRGYDPAPGFHLSGNAGIGKGMYLGAQLGLVHFRDLGGAYLPAHLKFSFLPAGRSGRAVPIVLLEPGYGFYDRKYRAGNGWYRRKGGFTFFAGVGAAFATRSKARPVLTLGYSRFDFKDPGYRFTRDAFGLRFGVMIF